MKISATRRTLLAIDIDGNPWELTPIDSENPQGGTLNPLPWMARDCLDIQGARSGGMALLRDGRRVEWNLGTQSTPAHIERIEPNAIVALGNAHGVGLLRNSMEIRGLPNGVITGLSGAPLSVQPELIASRYTQSAWYHSVPGTVLASRIGPALEFDALEEVDTGSYTFAAENAYGILRTKTLSVIAIPSVNLRLIEPVGASPSTRLRIQSSLIGNFPFNETEHSRWRLESAASVDGPWAWMGPVAGEIFGNAVTFTLPKEGATNQFFRVAYDPNGN
jgi:hypothetical protein